jgi:outer membrane protein, multidrug efflux system
MPADYSLKPAVATQPASQPATATQPAVAATQPSVDLATWWKGFNDPTLDKLIDQAIKSNLDLMVATARVREARALRDVAVADFFPQINATDSYSYSGSSLNTAPKTRVSRPSLLQRLLPAASLRNNGVNPATGALNPPTVSLNGVPLNGATGATAIGSGATLTSPTGSNATKTVHVLRGQNLFQGGFDASWEMDIFGRIRRGVEATEADVQAAEEARGNVLLTLLSDVSLVYVQLRGSQRRLEIAEENIRAQLDTLQVTEERFRAGLLASALDVAQARAQVESTRSQVPTFESSIRQNIYQLAVLLGESPAALVDELSESEPIPATPPEIPVGLPSELLRRRPDVRQAERQLAATTARIGAATADLFPRFALNAGLGTATRDLRHFLDQRSFLWSVGPSVSWPIFEGGRTIANIRAENARQEQALGTYARTVLVALQDVENALVAYNTERVRYDTLGRAVDADQQAVQLSNELYGGGRGLIPFLNVLDAERSLYAAQDQQVQSETTVVTNLISLYKALGGGWEDLNRPEQMCGPKPLFMKSSDLVVPIVTPASSTAPAPVVTPGSGVEPAGNR